MRASSIRLKPEQSRTISPISVTSRTLKERPENLLGATAIAEASAIPRHRTKTPRECPGGAAEETDPLGQRPGTVTRPGWRSEQARKGAVRLLSPRKANRKGTVREQKSLWIGENPSTKKSRTLPRVALAAAFAAVPLSFGFHSQASARRCSQVS